MSDNVIIIRNNKDNIKNYESLEKVLDDVDDKANRISEFHSKSVYVKAFATSIKELSECKKIAEKLHIWIDNNINLN